MSKQRVLQLLNTAGLIAVLVVNGLANAIPLNGKTTGDISDSFDVLFKPAGYVFSIWGLIYLALLAFVVFQWRSPENNDRSVEHIGIYFVLSCIANIAWLFCWHYEQFDLSVLVMLVLLFSLINIYQRLQIGERHPSLAVRWFGHVPFSLYLGWICVATLANITIFLEHLGWKGFGLSDGFWLVALLILGLSLAFLFVTQRRDAVFALVIAWAFAGIAVQNAHMGWIPTVSWIATAGAVVLVLFAIFGSKNYILER